MATRLRERADGPLEIPHHLPVGERLRGDVPPGELVVALEVGLQDTDAAERQIVSAEAPGAHTWPCEILGRVADVRELPVEHVLEAALAHHEVPDAEVAVANDGAVTLRRVSSCPGEPELDRRVRFVERVELVHKTLKEQLDAAAREERQAFA